MSSLSRRSLGRRQVAVLAAAVTVFGGFMAYRTQASAQAHPQDVAIGMTCDLGTAQIGVQVSYTVEHTPETAVAGELFTIKTKSAVAIDPAAPDLPVKSMKIHIPVPFGVSGGGAIETTGGNLTKAGQDDSASSTVLTLVADAGVTTKTIQVPALAIPVTIAEEYPETIVFEGPSKIELTIVLGAEATIGCTVNPGEAPLLQIKPTGGSVVEAPTTTKPSAGGATDKPAAVKATPRFTG